MRHVEPQVGKRWRWRCFATSWASWQRAHLGLTRLKQFQARIQLRCKNRILSCSTLTKVLLFGKQRHIRHLIQTAIQHRLLSVGFGVFHCKLMDLHKIGISRQWDRRLSALVQSHYTICALVMDAWTLLLKQNETARRNCAKQDLHEKTLLARELEVMQLHEEIQVKDAAYSDANSKRIDYLVKTALGTSTMDEPV